MAKRDLETAAAILTRTVLETFQAVAASEFKAAAVPTGTAALDGVYSLVETTYQHMLEAVDAMGSPNKGFRLHHLEEHKPKKTT